MRWQHAVLGAVMVGVLATGCKKMLAPRNIKEERSRCSGTEWS